LNLKLNTQKRQAEIKFCDGHFICGNFFISPFSKGSPSGENALELLNDSRSYLPFEIAESELSFLRKDLIMTVRMTVSEIPKELPYLRPVSAKIYLLSGDIFEGQVYIDLPKSHTRLSDFLNFSQQFIFINIDEQDVLINTAFVKMVKSVL
jgi:hypothetical protein